MHPIELPIADMTGYSTGVEAEAIQNAQFREV